MLGKAGGEPEQSSTRPSHAGRRSKQRDRNEHNAGSNGTQVSAPPFMTVHVSDYIADTRHLTALEHGSLLLLYMAVWRAGGRLDHNEKKLTRIIGCTQAQWKRIGPTVLSFFIIDDGALSIAEPGRHVGRRGREPMPPALRAHIIARDGGVCQYCGDRPETPHIDHITPVVHGGGNDEENLCVACPSCNLSKGAMMPEDWLQ